MTPAIRHYLDETGTWNGRSDQRTVCGLPWPGEQRGVLTDCPECRDLTCAINARKLPAGSSGGGWSGATAPAPTGGRP